MSQNTSKPMGLDDNTQLCTAGFKDIWRYMRAYPLKMAAILIVIAAFSAAALILPILVQYISHSFVSGKLSTLLFLSVMVMCFFVGRGALNFLQNVLVASLAVNVVNTIRNAVFSHIVNLDLTFYSKTRLGDLSYRVTGNVDNIASMVEYIFAQAVPAVVTGIVLIGYLCYLNLYLTLMIVLVAPVLGGSIFYLGRRILQYSQQAQQSVSNLNSYLAEFIMGIKVVKTFAQERFESQRFSRVASDYRDRQFSIQLVMALQYPLLGFSQGMCLMAIFITSGYCIHVGLLSVAQFMGYITAVGMLVDPIQKVAQIYTNIKQWQASIRRVFSVFDIVPEVQSPTVPTAVGPVAGRVCFDGVHFGYDVGDSVLRDLTLDIRDKEFVGIVGLSGAGKSTLLNLMMRFYDPTQGRVSLGGQDLRYFDLKTLRRHFGVVLQETHLFSDTIAANIAYSEDRIDLARVERVARLAQAHEFIEAFELGYHTLVTERGLNLSGGQKQRIAIARALYSNPKVLIFDEATSNIDAQSEAMIQESIDALRGEFTMIFVAHRLSTLQRADRIVVLERGGIVEQGSHHKLMSTDGRYKELVNKQSLPV